MQAQSELFSLPQALTEIFTKGRPDRERAVRGIRWGDGPIHVLADAASLPAGLVARYALEEMLHRPVIVRETATFLTYSLATLRTGSPVVSIGGENESAMVEAVKAVRASGAQVLAVAPAASPVAEAAHQVFVLPEVAGAPATGLAGACLQHAALGYFALIAARQLARPAPALERIEADWLEMPSALDKIVGQFANAVRSLARELGGLSRIFFAGAGLHHASALRAADSGGHREQNSALPLDFANLRSGWMDAFRSGTGVLLLSGSRSPFRQAAGDLVRELKQRGALVFAVTDANDQDVGREARLTLLVPDMAELPASILSLALAGWTARETALHPGAARPGGSEH